MLNHDDTPELQQRCIQAVRHGAEMRYAYTTALYQTYVANDIPIDLLDDTREPAII